MACHGVGKKALLPYFTGQTAQQSKSRPFQTITRWSTRLLPRQHFPPRARSGVTLCPPERSPSASRAVTPGHWKPSSPCPSWPLPAVTIPNSRHQSVPGRCPRKAPRRHPPRATRASCPQAVRPWWSCWGHVLTTGPRCPLPASPGGCQSRAVLREHRAGAVKPPVGSSLHTQARAPSPQSPGAGITAGAASGPDVGQASAGAVPAWPSRLCPRGAAREVWSLLSGAVSKSAFFPFEPTGAVTGTGALPWRAPWTPRPRPATQGHGSGPVLPPLAASVSHL